MSLLARKTGILYLAGDRSPTVKPQGTRPRHPGADLLHYYDTSYTMSCKVRMVRAADLFPGGTQVVTADPTFWSATEGRDYIHVGHGGPTVHPEPYVQHGDRTLHPGP